jgi:uncharacterized protein YciI
LLTYVKPLSEVDRLREAHFAYLRRLIDQGVILLAGRQVPRKGGVIIARGPDHSRLASLIEEDPFVAEGVATAHIVEFVPGNWHASLEDIVSA